MCLGSWGKKLVPNPTSSLAIPRWERLVWLGSTGPLVGLKEDTYIKVMGNSTDFSSWKDTAFSNSQKVTSFPTKQLNGCCYSPKLLLAFTPPRLHLTQEPWHRSRPRSLNSQPWSWVHWVPPGCQYLLPSLSPNWLLQPECDSGLTVGLDHPG